MNRRQMMLACLTSLLAPVLPAAVKAAKPAPKWELLGDQNWMGGLLPDGRTLVYKGITLRCPGDITPPPPEVMKVLTPPPGFVVTSTNVFVEGDRVVKMYVSAEELPPNHPGVV